MADTIYTTGMKLLLSSASDEEIASLDALLMAIRARGVRRD